MPKIFLDYGHGGNDPGAIGFGIKEKDINLKIGKRVKHHLERHAQTVIESRVGDTNPSLGERSSLANRNYVDVAISLHCNSFSTSNARGVEIYKYGNGSRETALAKSILNSIIKENLYTDNRGIKTENFHMVREIQTASVLLEMAFISNQSDNKILTQKSEEMSIAIAKGILSYFDIQYKAETVNKAPNSQLYRVQVGAYQYKENAQAMQKKLQELGITSVIVTY